jgi:hypothetical protein
MTKSIDDACKEIQTIVLAVSGIQAAPDYPPDKISQYPVSVCFAGSGIVTKEGAGVIRGLHQITLELHYQAKNRARAVEVLNPLARLIYRALFNDSNFSLNSTVDTINEISYEFGPLGYDSVDTIGYTFSIDVKIRETL